MRSLAIVLVVSGTQPLGLVAQDTPAWGLRLEAGAGAIYTDKSLGAVEGDTAVATLRTSPMASIGLIADTPVHWLRLRLGVTRTVLARLAVATFSHWSSCGVNCFHANYTHEGIDRGFSAAHANLSAEIAPFRIGPVAPYLEAGAGFKRLAFGDGPDGGYQGLAGSMIGRVYLLGLGFDVPVSTGHLRIRASDTFRHGNHSVHAHTRLIDRIEGPMRHDLRFEATYLWAP
jgi:hypothetical protein